MNMPSEDIKDILESISSLGLVFGTDLFIGKEPSSPEDCVTVFDTPGLPPQLAFEKDEKYQYPSIQIRVRNTGYVAGWTLANDIQDQLHGRAQETWNGTIYTRIASLGDPALLDYDDNDRPRFVLNFNIQRR